MIDFKEIPDYGEVWEQFARDFLAETGFQIETSPDRGADGGKDFLVTERLVGKVNTYLFRWLVTCKHFAKSNRSVSEQDEPNIRERLESFRADGFLGFYSTLPSSGFNTRLMALRNETKIRDYRIFDSREIENHLIRIGYSKLMMRYLPESYKRTRPLHLFNSQPQRGCITRTRRCGRTIQPLQGDDFIAPSPSVGDCIANAGLNDATPLGLVGSGVWVRVPGVARSSQPRAD